MGGLRDSDPFCQATSLAFFYIEILPSTAFHRSGMGFSSCKHIGVDSAYLFATLLSIPDLTGTDVPSLDSDSLTQKPDAGCACKAAARPGGFFMSTQTQISDTKIGQLQPQNADLAKLIRASYSSADLESVRSALVKLRTLDLK